MQHPDAVAIEETGDQRLLSLAHAPGLSWMKGPDGLPNRSRGVDVRRPASSRGGFAIRRLAVR